MSLLKFTQQALSDFQKTAAVAPSSRYLVQAMVEPLPLANAKVVVEFGPGTGAMTRELLRRMPSERDFTRSHRIAYRVLVEAVLTTGARFRRDAILWLTPGEAAPFARLAWREGRW